MEEVAAGQAVAGLGRVRLVQRIMWPVPRWEDELRTRNCPEMPGAITIFRGISRRTTGPGCFRFKLGMSVRSGKNGQSSAKLPSSAKAAAGAAAAPAAGRSLPMGPSDPQSGGFLCFGGRGLWFPGGRASASRPSRSFARHRPGLLHPRPPVLLCGRQPAQDGDGADQRAGDRAARQRAQGAGRPQSCGQRGALETLVNALPFGLVVSRGEQIIVANPAAVELFRAGTAAAPTGGSMWDTVHPDYREIVRQRMAMLDQGGNGNGDRGRRLEAIEEKFLRLDGTVLDAEVSGGASSSTAGMGGWSSSGTSPPASGWKGEFASRCGTFRFCTRYRARCCSGWRRPTYLSICAGWSSSGSWCRWRVSGSSRTRQTSR